MRLVRPFLFVALVPLAPTPLGAAATVIPVTTTADGVPGSLRAAISQAGSTPDADEIVLQAGAIYELTVCEPGQEDGNGEGDLDHSASGGELTISGSGARIRNTCLGERVLHDLGAERLILRDVTITGGDATGNGGGVLAGDVHLRRTSVVDNRSGGQGGGVRGEDVSVFGSLVAGNMSDNDGGGLHALGRTSIFGSTFSRNSVPSEGGGALIAGATLRVEGSSFVDNHAYDGGALFVADGSSITASTFVGNTAQTRGGTFFLRGASVLNGVTVTDGDAPQGSVAWLDNPPDTSLILNSIVVSAGPACAGQAAFSSAYSIHDGTCGGGPGDMIGVDPLLGPLADNGGPTMTRALLAGSPAIDAGSPESMGSTACYPGDQRGMKRLACDVGAYEVAFCLGVVVNRIGTEGDDVLLGTEGPDGVLAFGGDDVVVTGDGPDGVCAGRGKDLIRTGRGKDRARGDADKDVIRGGVGRDLLDGGAGADVLMGQAGNDILTGRRGRDRLVGGSGRRDRCSGGPGPDVARSCEV